MAQQKIRFHAAEDVKEFVKAAAKCNFDIDVSYNRAIVDAKSLLGIYSLGLANTLTVQCHGESPEFIHAIQKFCVA